MRMDQGAGDPVERVLRQVGEWMGSDAPIPSRHPETVAFAAYVDWLARGAEGECPEPEVQAHAAACRTCYRKAEDLLLADLQAARQHESDLLAAFGVTLAREPEGSYLMPASAPGSAVRLPLGPLPGGGMLYPLAGAVAEAAATRPASAELPWNAPDPARVSVEVRPSAGRFDLSVAARHPCTGEGLPGLAVRLLSDAGEAIREDVTDAQGCAGFYSLEPRGYRIEVRARGGACQP